MQLNEIDIIIFIIDTFISSMFKFSHRCLNLEFRSDIWILK